MKHEKNSNLTPIICKVEYAFLSDVIGINIGSPATYRQVQFIPHKSWNEIYNTPGRVSYEEPSVKSSAGTLFEQKLELFYPGDDVKDLSEFDNYEEQRFIVKFTYSNGVSKLLGGKTSPCRFEKNLSTSESGSTITFYKNSVSRAFVLEN